MPIWMLHTSLGDGPPSLPAGRASPRAHGWAEGATPSARDATERAAATGGVEAISTSHGRDMTDVMPIWHDIPESGPPFHRQWPLKSDLSRRAEQFDDQPRLRAIPDGRKGCVSLGVARRPQGSARTGTISSFKYPFKCLGLHRAGFPGEASRLPESIYQG